MLDVDVSKWAEVRPGAPFGGAEGMVKDFKAKLYPNDPVRFVAVTAAGAKEVRVL
ncbi:MAG: hypothetical protein ABL894_05205 [Hyphomicrobium sp.]